MGQTSIKEINTLDKKIIKYLLTNSGASNQEIAKEVGSSATSVWRRLQRLEQVGVISREKFVLNLETVGLTETFYVIVMLSDGEKTIHDSFRQYVHGCENIVSCQSITGDYDYLLTVIAENMAQCAGILEALMDKNVVRKKITMGAMKSIKEDVGGLIDVL